MICGNCKAPATGVDTVRACYAGQRVPCGWLVDRGRDEDGGQVATECGAHTTFTDRGWTCEAGHEHVTMEARHAEGWEYAEDYGEARNLAFAGVEPRTMDGHVVTGRESFA